MANLKRIFGRTAIALTLTTALLSGCGNDSSTTESKSKGAFPVTISSGGQDVTVAAKPKRIISLSPTATESLFAIDAKSQVVAVDDQSTYPADAPKTTLSGFTPNVEAILGYQPDLVVASGDANSMVAGLTAAKVPTVIMPAAKDFNDAYGQIETLGTITGNTAKATEVVTDMKAKIDAAVKKTGPVKKDVKIYHEVDNTFYSSTSTTFAGQVYGLFGLKNIADGADTTGSGYPQLSAEYIITSNPQIIFLADTKCCAQSLTTLAERPGWSNIAAIKSGSVVSLDDDVASRWGPRVADFATQVGEAVVKQQAVV